jgi:type IV secretory pathway VirB10-like protein
MLPQAFISYVRSIFLQKDKTIFKLDTLPLESFATSLGLAGAPKIKFNTKQEAATKKNAVRQVEEVKAELAVAGSGSETEGEIDEEIQKAAEEEEDEEDDDDDDDDEEEEEEEEEEASAEEVNIAVDKVGRSFIVQRGLKINVFIDNRIRSKLSTIECLIERVKRFFPSITRNLLIEMRKTRKEVINSGEDWTTKRRTILLR